MKYYLFSLFAVLCLLCGSCSNTDNRKEKQTVLTEHAQAVTNDLAKAYHSGIISEATSKKATANIIKYSQKGFIGKYWPIPIFLFAFFGLGLYAYNLHDETVYKELQEPMKVSDLYPLLFCLGAFGFHLIRLRKMSWLAWTTILLTTLSVLLNYSNIWYFYNTPQLLLIHNFSCLQYDSLYIFYFSELIIGGLFLINILIGLIASPYFVYCYNSSYFRKHYENDDILAGKQIEVDKFYNVVLVPHMKTLTHDLENINEHLRDDNYILRSEEDEQIDGFFKGIFTLGKSSNLKFAIGRLRALSEDCKGLSEHLKELDSEYSLLRDYLQKYRIAAYRNLYLAKELIKIIKDKLSAQQQRLIVDEFTDIAAPNYSQTGSIYIDANTITFDSETFKERFANSCETAFTNMNNYIENIENPTKEDLSSTVLVNGAILVAKTAFAAIEGLFSMNSRYSEALRNTEAQISDCLNYLKTAIPNTQSYQAVLARQSEIMLALSKCNKAFVFIYEPLRSVVFGEPTIKQFLHGVEKNKEIFKTDRFRKDLQTLILTCTEYNKVNKATVNSNAANNQHVGAQAPAHTPNEPVSKTDTTNNLPESQAVSANSSHIKDEVDESSNEIRENVINIISKISGRNYVAKDFLLENIGINPPYLLRRTAEELTKTYRVIFYATDFEDCASINDVIANVTKKLK